MFYIEYYDNKVKHFPKINIRNIDRRFGLDRDLRPWCGARQNRGTSRRHYLRKLE